jgi:predicted anti-sigma-YlaC factor YlaD
MVERTLAQRSLFSQVVPGCLLLAWLAGSGCSIHRYALNQASDAVAQSGATYASDDDPELVKAAAPFGLKLTESLLAENPRHLGLLTSAADEVEPHDFAAAEAMRARARRLYLRAQGYGLRGLEVKHPGFGKALLANPKATVRTATKPDVPLLYWTAAAWASAISLSKDNPELVGQIPAMEALMDRALELDESYGHGSIHTFMITYEMSRSGAAGDPAARARKHFDRALVLANGTDASPLVALAEAVAVQKQDVKEFESLLHRALAVNPDANPDTRLLNTVMQRRARWLLSRQSELFLIESK